MRLMTKAFGRVFVFLGVMLVMSAVGSATAVAGVERLSLFASDGHGAHEDQRLPSTLGNLPARGISVDFSDAGAVPGGRVWTWTLKNVSASPIVDLRLTVFLDADQSVSQNTFFNEIGALLGLSAPAGHIVADRWEISEPGYWSGNLLPRAATGDLLNQVIPDPGAENDVAMALSMAAGTLNPGQTVIVTATLDNVGSIGLKQIDQTDGSSLVFHAHAQLLPLAPGNTPATDLHVTMSSASASAGIGDTVEYRIVAGNNGPLPVAGAHLLGTIPAGLDNIVWSCSGTAGADCGAVSGSGGAISLAAVSLPVGAAVTILATGRASSNGVLVGTAEIRLPVGMNDPNPANNLDSASVTAGSHPAGAGGAHGAHGIPTLSEWGVILLVLLLGAQAGIALAGRKCGRGLLGALAVLCTLSVLSPDAEALFENGDFESGSFEHWTSFSASNPGLGGAPPFKVEHIKFRGSSASLLRAIAGRLFDPRAAHLSLPRQGNFSAKVNDEKGGAHINALGQRGVITERDRDPVDGKLHVRFSYAAVLEDPGHGATEQPYFHVQLKDLTSNTVLYDDFAYSGQPGRIFHTSVYANSTWRSTPFIDVDMEVPDNSLGHDLEVRVLAADCSLGGHGGYVYVDAFGAFRIPPQGGCLNGLKVRGKPGQVQLTWPDNGAAAYAIYRSDSFEGPYRRVAVTESRYSTWLDTGVVARKSYYYRVHPLDADGNETCTSGEIVGVVPEGWQVGGSLKRPPRFVSDPVVSGDVRDRFSYQPNVAAGDAGTLSFALRYAPLEMTVDPATGKLEWQPSSAGTYQVHLEAKDASGQRTNQAFSIKVDDGNRPPAIASRFPDAIPAGTPFSHQIEASDPDGDALIYSVASQASGMTINATGLVSWSSPQPGTYPVVVSVTDARGAGSRQQVVTKVEGAPVFGSRPVRSATVGDPYRYDATATDRDGDSVTYALAEGPAGMTVDPASGRVEWMPATPGRFPVQLVASDPRGNTGVQSYHLYVSTTPNRPPVFTATPLTFIAYPSNYYYSASAADSDNDTLTWTLLKGPPGMTINALDGFVSWWPPITVSGLFDIEIQVDDRRGGVAVQRYTLRVPVAGNQPPRITGTPPDRVMAGTEYLYVFSADDPDLELLSFTLAEGPATMKLVASTISWLPNEMDIGIHPVRVEVRDPVGNVTSQDWRIEVFPASVNRPPLFSTLPVTVTTAGSVYVYAARAHDPDGDPLTFALRTAPAGMTISADGRVEWMVPVGATGSFPVEIGVSDGRGGSALQGFAVGIGMPANQPPAIISTPPTSATVGTPYAYGIYVNEPEREALSFHLDTAPTGMTVSASGRIEWTPGPAQGGFHPVTVRVVDARGASVSQSFTIHVRLALNRAPFIGSDAVLRAATGVPYTYQVKATDHDKDPLSYSLPIAPAGMIVSPAGLVSWSSPVAGKHPVTLQVSDGRGGVAQQSYTLEVSSSNRAPVIDSVPITVATVGQPYRYEIKASDPDGDYLTHTLISPSFMTMTADRAIEWTPMSPQTLVVTVRVSDGRLHVDQSFTLTVAAAGSGPLAASISATPRFINAGESTTIRLVPQGGTPPYTVTGFSVDGVSRPLDASFQTTVTASTTGKRLLRASLRDSKYASITVDDWFAVVDPADTDNPVAHIGAPGDSNDIAVTDVGEPVDIVGTASDSRFAEYILRISPAGKGQWTELAKRAAPVTGGVLGRINTQVIANGLYDVELISRDLAGKESRARITLAIAGEQKTAPLRLTFEDFSYDVEGLPLSVRRTYDSLRRNESLDFGHGWSIDYQDALVQTNGVPGRGWTLIETGSGFGRKLCPRPTGSRVVAIRLPGGGLEQFEFRAEPECVSLLTWSGYFGITLAPKAGNKSGSTLVALGHTDLRIAGSDLIDMGTAQTFDPVQYRLTTREGTQYTLDRTFGIREVRDRQGNTLRFSSDGIAHSGGWSLNFVRDAGGRISEIRGPGNLHRTYAYDPFGNLVSAAEPGGATATFRYEDVRNPHGLTGYSDPAGRLQLRTEYDADGRVIRQTDALGGAVNIATDPGARTQTVRDRNGNATVYGFDARGNITRVVDAAGGVTQYEYDARGNEIAVTDPLGRKTMRAYDAWGNVVSETDPLGRTVVTEYNANGEVTRIVGPAGRVSTSTYNASGQLERLTDAAGHPIGLGYAAGGSLASLTDALGQQTRFTYGPVNGTARKLSETAVDGSVTTFGYDAAGRETLTVRSLTLAPGASPVAARDTRVYDADGRVQSETDAAGNTVSYVYDPTGQLIQETDPLGRATRHEYTARGERSRTLHPDGRIDTWTFDANGNEIRACTGTGSFCTNTAYDALDRPVSVSDPLGNTTLTAYDAAGQIVSVTDPRGNATTYTHDAGGRRTSQTDAEGNVLRWRHDIAGNLVEETDALGQITAHSYDSLDRRTATTLPTGETVSFIHDALGRRTREIDATGQATAYGYDALGRLERVTDAEGNATAYAWNTLGQLLSQTDANGRVTAYGYDLLGRRTRRTLPDGSAEQLEYDATGKLIAHTDFAGQRTARTWDVGGKPVEVFRPDGTLTHGYDSYRRLSTLTDSVHGSVHQTLDAADRLTGVSTHHAAAPGSTLSAAVVYQWDPAGNRTRVQVGAGATAPGIDATYDKAGRLVRLVAPGGGRTDFTYDGNGNRSRVTRANGSTSEYRHDAANRLIGLIHRRADGSVLAEFAYTLDGNGRRIALEETVAGKARRLSWRYDRAGRLLEESIDDGSGPRVTAYAWDGAGNRIRRDDAGLVTTYVYDANDRLLSETTGGATTTYAWDANGNLARRQEGGKTTVYHWNSQNRLTRIDDGARRIDYGYDAEGRRIKRLVSEGTNSVETHYVIDSARAHGETIVERTRVGSGAFSERTYVHTPDGTGELLSELKGGTAIHYYPDGQGSTRLIADQAQNVLETHAHDAFGRRTGGAGGDGHQYTGEYFDAASGFYHLRARDYDPRIGRFVSMDEHPGTPRIPLTLNKYLYGNADPVNTIDPSGRIGVGMSMGGLNVNMYLSAISVVSYSTIARQIAFGGGRAFVLDNGAKLINAAVHSGTFSIAVKLAKYCLGSGAQLGKDCRPGFNLFIPGDTTPEHRDFVADSISLGAPFSLNYQAESHSRAWLARSGCKGSRPDLLDCDEYPYASSQQGGEFNPVWTRVLGASDNRRAGALLGDMYKRCGMRNGDRFYVLPLHGAPTIGLCEK